VDKQPAQSFERVLLDTPCRISVSSIAWWRGFCSALCRVGVGCGEVATRATAMKVAGRMVRDGGPLVEMGGIEPPSAGVSRRLLRAYPVRVDISILVLPPATHPTNPA
jgi:hypothetical protein